MRIKAAAGKVMSITGEISRTKPTERIAAHRRLIARAYQLLVRKQRTLRRAPVIRSN